MKADLHLHTTASDGRLTPEQLVTLAAKTGLDVIAVTDHDTVSGIIPALNAAKSVPSLKVIPGVELSTDVSHGEIHVLGYFLDFTDKEFLTELNELGESREGRALKMVNKLHDLGRDISFNRVRELAKGSSIGRPHIAQALLEAGYITTEKEAFEKYIGRDGPAYADRKKMLPIEAVQLILKAQGLPVLAHPSFVNNLDTTVAELKSAGLIGMEVYYAGYSKEVIRNLNGMAKKYGLIPTGGTDYHAFNDGMEFMIGSAMAPQKSVEALFSMAAVPMLELLKKYR